MTRYFLFSVAAAVLAVAAYTRIRWNHTPSVPVGVYAAVPETVRPRYLEFCPAEPWASLSRARAYREPAGLGPACADRAEPLIKRIAAEAGDTVEFGVGGVSVNGEMLPMSAARRRDTAGREIAHYPFGTYILGDGKYWVMGDDYRSFDSRYYGPVDTSQVRTLLVSVVVND